jgi:hypothetical protein
MLIQNFPHWKRHMLEGDKRCKDGVLERFLSIIRTYSASKSTALIKDPAAKSILFSIYPAAKFTTFAIDHGTKPTAFLTDPDHLGEISPNSPASSIPFSWCQTARDLFLYSEKGRAQFPNVTYHRNHLGEISPSPAPHPRWSR